MSSPEKPTNDQPPPVQPMATGTGTDDFQKDNYTAQERTDADESFKLNVYLDADNIDHEWFTYLRYA